MLIVRNPEDGFASLTPSIAGSLQGGGGFNEKGIAIGMQTRWSKDVAFLASQLFLEFLWY